jgi:hypothetical protein
MGCGVIEAHGAADEARRLPPRANTCPTFFARRSSPLLFQLRFAIISRRDAMPDVVRLPLGTLDTPLAPPTAHYFVASKAEWYEIHDDLPQFAER